MNHYTLILCLLFSISVKAQTVIVGDELPSSANFYVNNTNPEIGFATNTLLSTFERFHNNSRASFNIFAYPDTPNVLDHLRKSIMLYSTGDAEDFVICTAPVEGAIRFVTDDWFDPSGERARINSTGLGIGTTDPKEKLHVSDGDIYIEDINKGVIMKSPDGQCWRMTMNNDGTPKYSSVSCP